LALALALPSAARGAKLPRGLSVLLDDATAPTG
jgi:hypothetical protein